MTAGAEHWFESQPDWFKTAVFYELHTRAFFDSSDDGSGDFRGLRQKLDYLQWLGIDCIWLLPFYPSPLRDGGYDVADFLTVSPEFGTVDEFASFVEAAHERGMRVISDFVMNHTSSEHPWFQESRQGADNRAVGLVRLVGHGSPLRGRADHLRRLGAVELDVRPGPRRLLLAPLLPPPARPELREPRRRRRDARRPALLARPRPRRVPPRRRAVPVRGGGDELREPPADARVPQARAGRGRRALHRPGAARRGEPVARGRRGLLRRRGRVPHGVPLPRDAAHVHGAPPGGGAADGRDPRPHAADPGQLPVGALPAQPRRADARDGDGRGAGLHVLRSTRRTRG